MAIPEQYRIEEPRIPDEDRSGHIGQRLLKLLSIQAERNIKCAEADRRKAGVSNEDWFDTSSQYFRHFAGGGAYALAALSRFGEPGTTMAGTTREGAERIAISMIRAVAGSHKLGGGEEEWSTFGSGRHIHTFGMAAWLLLEKLDQGTRLLVARILEYEADRFLGAPAPAQLYDDTQAESNAWTGGGIAVASCMLKQHPRRAAWAEKAKEYMISAYATADDVASERVVDGKPLNEWLTGPNAFPDYSVENHGFVHPDYLAAVSEMVRSAIAFHLADEPIPEAVTFNADHVLDLLMLLLLPDGTHLYVQSTDYTPRRVDSFFQACDIVPLMPTPLRKACFLRALDTLERMASERPELPMSAWIGCPYDLGVTWGLTQNYLIGRLFGAGDQAVPDDEVEAELAAVHVSSQGRFAVHRTPTTLSSFSWHAEGDLPKVMGMTMPLDRDVLCYPLPWGYIGEVREAGEDASLLKEASHSVTECEDGFGVTLELEWRSGKVRQDCAFVSLPDGRSVYLEQRQATREVAVALATSGNVAIYDDPQLLYQKGPRVFHGEEGELDASAPRIRQGNWLNVDDRMGYVALTNSLLRLGKQKGRPCIWRGTGTMYDTCRLEFVHVAEDAEGAQGSAKFEAGARIGTFAMVTCPCKTGDETAALAAEIKKHGWHMDQPGALALMLSPYLVYANFSEQNVAVSCGSDLVKIDAKSCGWNGGT